MWDIAFGVFIGAYVLPFVALVIVYYIASWIE